MNDLLKTIRAEARPKGTGNYRDELWHAAADEITRLSAINAELLKALQIAYAIIIEAAEQGEYSSQEKLIIAKAKGKTP